MKLLYFILLYILFTVNTNAQVDPELLVNIHSVMDDSTMNLVQPSEQGSLLYNEADKNLYIWEGNSWKPATDFKTVENEILLEDITYYFVSMKVGSNNYKVVRYDKANLNSEDVSEGTGNQPIDIVTVQNLNYN